MLKLLHDLTNMYQYTRRRRGSMHSLDPDGAKHSRAAEKESWGKGEFINMGAVSCETI